MHASAQNGPGERRSGWYVGVGGGATGASPIDHTGFSHDPQCYPTSACFDRDPRPEFPGYRWARDLDPSAGATFELAAGHVGRRPRFELSFGQRTNDVDQMLHSFTRLHGTVVAVRRGSTVTSNATEDVDDLSVRTLAVSAYYHFRDAVADLDRDGRGDILAGARFRRQRARGQVHEESDEITVPVPRTSCQARRSHPRRNARRRTRGRC